MSTDHTPDDTLEALKLAVAAYEDPDIWLDDARAAIEREHVRKVERDAFRATAREMLRTLESIAHDVEACDWLEDERLPRYRAALSETPHA